MFSFPPKKSMTDPPKTEAASDDMSIPLKESASLGELTHEALFFLLAIEFVEVGAAEVLVLLLLSQQVIDNDQERMGQSNGSTLLAAPKRQTMILGREISVLTM